VFTSLASFLSCDWWKCKHTIHVEASFSCWWIPSGHTSQGLTDKAPWLENMPVIYFTFGSFLGALGSQWLLIQYNSIFLLRSNHRFYWNTPKRYLFMDRAPMSAKSPVCMIDGAKFEGRIVPHMEIANHTCHDKWREIVHINVHILLLLSSSSSSSSSSSILVHFESIESRHKLFEMLLKYEPKCRYHNIGIHFNNTCKLT